MFESLSSRLQDAFSRFGTTTTLNETDVQEAMREVRLALLEADVSLKVVREFIQKVSDRAIGSSVSGNFTPAQQVLAIVQEELIAMLGGTDEQTTLHQDDRHPSIIMLVGLQGAGKTTSAAKLAYYLQKQGEKPLLVAADVYRPAAILQLQTLGKQHTIPVYAENTDQSPVDICIRAQKFGIENNFSPIIIDTAGRLTLNETMMQEVVQIRERLQPSEILLVADAMTGQEAVRVAEDFHAAVHISGLILTKMDSDARGGAALSIRAMTGVPIKFLGTSEKVEGLDAFYPDRLVSRMLGMGDVLSLIERAQEELDEDEMVRAEEKMKQGKFDFADFLSMMKQMKRLGPLRQVMGMMPGLGKMLDAPEIQEALDGDHLKYVEAIILSMTPEERKFPHILQSSRKKRIALGSGTSLTLVNNLVKQFEQMSSMMSQMYRGKGHMAALAQQFMGANESHEQQRVAVQLSGSSHKNLKAIRKAQKKQRMRNLRRR